MTIDEQRKARFRFLHCLYEMTSGDEYVRVNMGEVGSRLGFELETTFLIFQYLAGEGLVVAKAIGGFISITHYGVVNIENALSQPDKPTPYFPPVNIINIHSMVNSNIQQGSPSATQTVTYTSADITKIGVIVDELNAAIANLRLSSEKSSELRADIDALRTQLASPKPKTTIIKEAGKSIRNILEGVAGSLIATGIVAQLKQLGI